MRISHLTANGRDSEIGAAAAAPPLRTEQEHHMMRSVMSRRYRTGAKSLIVSIVLLSAFGLSFDED